MSGTTTLYDGHLQMVHPDRVVDEAGLAKLAADRSGLPADRRPASEPAAQGDRRRARARAGICPNGRMPPGSSTMAFPALLTRCAACIARRRRTIYAPQSAAWSRLAYDELLAGQLALALLRGHMRTRAGRGSAAEGRLRARIVAALPYTLTPSQERAVRRHHRRPGAAATACCACCTATSAPARQWWRCSPPRP